MRLLSYFKSIYNISVWCDVISHIVGPTVTCVELLSIVEVFPVQKPPIEKNFIVGPLGYTSPLKPAT